MLSYTGWRARVIVYIMNVNCITSKCTLHIDDIKHAKIHADEVIQKQCHKFWLPFPRDEQPSTVTR